MIDRICNRCGNAGDSNLTDATATDGIEIFVGDIEPAHIDMRHIGMNRDQIARQIGVRCLAMDGVKDQLFH